VNCLQPRCHTTPIRLVAASQQSSAAVALPATNSTGIPHFPLLYSTVVNISGPSPSNYFSNRLKKSPQNKKKKKKKKKKKNSEVPRGFVPVS